MATLASMTLNFLENLLNDNPTVQIFTSYFFSDIPAAAGNNNIAGNPTRTQVLAAYQSQVDQSKYGVGGAASGIIFPVVFPDPSTYSLGGKISTSGNIGSGTGQAGQAPQNAVSVTQASIAPVPAISNPADDNVPSGVFPIPPVGNNYKQRVQVNTDVK